MILNVPVHRKESKIYKIIYSFQIPDTEWVWAECTQIFESDASTAHQNQSVQSWCKV